LRGYVGTVSEAIDLIGQYQALALLYLTLHGGGRVWKSP
jgi:hypothetical protein